MIFLSNNSAWKFLNFFFQVEKRQRKKRLADEDDAAQPAHNGHADENDVEINGTRGKKKPRADDDEDDPYAFADTSMRSERSERNLRPRGDAASTATVPPIELSPEKFAAFKKLVSEVFQTQHVTTLPVAEVVRYIGDHSNQFLFTRAEIDGGLADMSEKEQILVTDGQIFLLT